MAETVPVNENSIAQLIGVDRDGREVYEEVIRVADSKPFPTEATFANFSVIRDEEVVLVPS